MTVERKIFPNSVLLIPAVDWYHFDPALAGCSERWAQQTPRLPAALSWMLEQLRAYACRATVGFFGETVARQPELARAVIGADCEAAAMTYDSVDPWPLPTGALRDQVEKTAEIFVQAGLPRPTTFLPPFPANQPLPAAFISALREAGIARTAGCAGEGLAAVWLAEFAGRPLAGVMVRFLPTFFIRQALAKGQGLALCISPMDVDPGAPGAGAGRGLAMRRLPRLLRRGFGCASEVSGSPT